MALELHYCVHAQNDLADDTVIGDSTKLTNAKSTTINGGQTTTARQPFIRDRGSDGKLNAFACSLVCDGGDSLTLSTTVNMAGSPYTLAICWANGDYTSDTWLFTAADNDAHYGIDAGGAGVLLKPNSNRSPGGDEDTIPTNNTDNGTVSYTFGSDVEALIVVNENDDDVLFYNINGDLIATASESLYDSNFNLQQILGSSGANGLDGHLLDLQVWDNVALPANSVGAIAAYYRQLKD